MNYLKFWGVRGSIPAPGPETVRYGGNTACIELKLDEQLFILDAGTGLRNFGSTLKHQNQSLQFNFFFSHTHWDHIQGLPFFMPAYNPKNKLNFYGAGNLKDILSGQMQPDYFPLKIENLNAELSFHSIEPGIYDVQGVSVEAFPVNHPGITFGYRFKTGDIDIVYISDNEPPELKSDMDPLVAFVQNADILIHDAQYTPEEYSQHKGWGHSPFTYPVESAVQSNIKRLILFHHDPQHNDDAVDIILKRSLKFARKLPSALDISAASEGLRINL